jgi:hypothetical protein
MRDLPSSIDDILKVFLDSNTLQQQGLVIPISTPIPTTVPVTPPSSSIRNPLYSCDHFHSPLVVLDSINFDPTLPEPFHIQDHANPKGLKGKM